MKKNPLSLHLNAEDFAPASAEEKESLVVMRESVNFWADGLRRLLEVARKRELLTELAAQFGAQCVVVAIDAKYNAASSALAQPRKSDMDAQSLPPSRNAQAKSATPTVIATSARLKGGQAPTST